MHDSFFKMFFRKSANLAATMAEVQPNALIDSEKSKLDGRAPIWQVLGGHEWGQI
jgi:hypothetical protein